jgi:hypothetical protein
MKNKGGVILSAPWACGPPNQMKNKDGVILTLSGAEGPAVFVRP